MKLAVIGKGGTGEVVIKRAVAEGHEVALVLSSKDSVRSATDLTEDLRKVDAVIDFSVSSAVLRNVAACALAGVPLIEGTTGWYENEQEARQIVRLHNGAFVFGANFSIGANLFYRIVEHTTELFSKVEGYSPFIEEQHHNKKKDAPSGTALKLKKMMETRWSGEVSVASTRAGFIPGTHRVGFDSSADQILLSHEARSREGFAAGALFAAKWIQGRRGIYEFSQVIDEILKR
jgi:4-hydroxy-tetrahydrodipicolinate reductase